MPNFHLNLGCGDSARSSPPMKTSLMIDREWLGWVEFLQNLQTPIYSYWFPSSLPNCEITWKALEPSIMVLFCHYLLMGVLWRLNEFEYELFSAITWQLGVWTHYEVDILKLYFWICLIFLKYDAMPTHCFVIFRVLNVSNAVCNEVSRM